MIEKLISRSRFQKTARQRAVCELVRFFCAVSLAPISPAPGCRGWPDQQRPSKVSSGSRIRISVRPRRGTPLQTRGYRVESGELGSDVTGHAVLRLVKPAAGRFHGTQTGVGAPD